MSEILRTETNDAVRRCWILATHWHFREAWNRLSYHQYLTSYTFVATIPANQEIHTKLYSKKNRSAHFLSPSSANHRVSTNLTSNRDYCALTQPPVTFEVLFGRITSQHQQRIAAGHSCDQGSCQLHYEGWINFKIHFVVNAQTVSISCQV